jgi:lysosomal acid lipase/cholesteryl ester hydrolase
LQVEFINLYNYGAETHTVTTKDGYILEIHRITGTKSNSNPAHKRVVFLQHGLLCSSMDWVLAGPEKGLGKSINAMSL